MQDERTGKPEPPAWGAAIGTVVFAGLFMGANLVWVPGRLCGWVVRPPLFPLARALGAVLLVLAIPVLLSFLYRFATEGRGTPAPFAAPQRLVRGGPYRRVRNPAYVGAVAFIAGLGLWFGSPGVLGWAAFNALVFHLFVVLYEEPTLRRKFGADYESYCREVPRWLPKLRRGRVSGGGTQPGRRRGRLS